MQDLYKEIASKLRNKNTRSILISTHDRPDGDAIGSAVALELALKAMGKRVHLTFQDKVHKRFAPIVGDNRIEKELLPPDGYIYDVAFLLDCSDLNRTYGNHRSSAKFHIVMDHHVPNKSFGDIYVHEYAPAAAVLVHRLLKELDIKITPEIANALYLAYRSDTGGFVFPNTNSELHILTAELLEHGAKPQQIADMFSTSPHSFTRLLGEVLSDYLSVNERNGLTYAYITQDVVEKNDATFEDAGRIIDFIRNIEGTEIALLFLEGQDGIRIRARSRDVPVNTLMQQWGGNGHDRAAGAFIPNRMLERVIEDVVKYTDYHLATTPRLS